MEQVKTNQVVCKRCGAHVFLGPTSYWDGVCWMCHQKEFIAEQHRLYPRPQSIESKENC